MRIGIIAVPKEAFANCESVHELTLLSVIAMIYDEFGHCILPIDDLATMAMISTGKTSQCLASLTNKHLLKSKLVISASSLCAGRQEACSACGTIYPLLEKHHIIFVSNGGLDIDENIAYICPNCHRLAHSYNYIPYWVEITEPYLPGEAQ